MTTAITPISPHIGGEIVGCKGADLLSRQAADDCLAGLREHGVLVYREIGIDDEELVAFSRLLGDVVVQPTGEHAHPEIQTITMDPEKTNPVMIAYRKSNFLWHIDGMHDPAPQKGTLLVAREVDEAGGDTEFASTFAAYEALPEAEKAELAGLRVVHNFHAAQVLAHPASTEEERKTWPQPATSVHPLVWTHRDGRKSLLIGATAALVLGMTVDKSRALLDRLLAWSTQPRFVLRHKWHRGDLVIWDNTGMIHRAMPFEATSRRLMHRTTLVGEEAVA